MKFITFFICITFVTFVANAQEQKCSNPKGHTIDIKIYFPYDESYIDSLYMENHTSMHLIDSILKDSLYISTLREIDIIAQSSPEGSVAHNERLSERRKQSLEKYFTTNYPQIEPSLWSFQSMAENWDLFREHLAEDPNLPNREEVLAITDGDRELDVKEWLLKTMNGGKTWEYIKERILPTQRFGASVLFIPIEEPTIEEPITEVDTIVVVETQQVTIVEEPIEEPIEEKKESDILFALKTNLLLDVVSVINIAAEIPIGNKFSVVGEVVYPWWRSWPNNYTMQIESYHAELKYWLGNRTRENRLTGWSVGVYGGWGLYDVQIFSETGVQGDFYDVGAQVGYSHQIAKNLHLEYTLGLGYISTKYNDYYMAYDTEDYGDIKVIPYPWMNSKLSTVLPTRLGVSLVWLINTNRKGGNK
ncbi:MAG: DUF3575 domain-containing protein [Rikenellaceae bacterium]